MEIKLGELALLPVSFKGDLGSSIHVVDRAIEDLCGAFVGLVRVVVGIVHTLLDFISLIHILLLLFLHCLPISLDDKLLLLLHGYGGRVTLLDFELTRLGYKVVEGELLLNQCALIQGFLAVVGLLLF